MFMFNARQTKQKRLGKKKPFDYIVCVKNEQNPIELCKYLLNIYIDSICAIFHIGNCSTQSESSTSRPDKIPKPEK